MLVRKFQQELASRVVYFCKVKLKNAQDRLSFYL